MMTKAELRTQIRAMHQGQAERIRQSALACMHILQSDEYGSARVIGGYLPLKRELDITPVLKRALASGKTLVLPRCESASFMTMRLVRSLAEPVPGPYGLMEPPVDAPIVNLHDIDLLLVPLEAIDRSGMRLGKGGGYYDRLLSGAHVFSMGCALTWQWVSRVPHDVWDRPLHACADASGVHTFANI